MKGLKQKTYKSDFPFKKISLAIHEWIEERKNENEEGYPVKLLQGPMLGCEGSHRAD